MDFLNQIEDYELDGPSKPFVQPYVPPVYRPYNEALGQFTDHAGLKYMAGMLDAGKFDGCNVLSSVNVIKLNGG